MYPSILSSAGISPESIDIESSMYRTGCRFDEAIIYVKSTMVHNRSNASIWVIGICVIGADEHSESPYFDKRDPDPRMECIIAELYDVFDNYPDRAFIKSMMREIIIAQDPISLKLILLK
jgi:hypothetical protein